MADEKIIFSMAGVSKIYPPQKQVLKNIYLSFFYGAKIVKIFYRWYQIKEFWRYIEDVQYLG